MDVAAAYLIVVFTTVFGLATWIAVTR